MQIFVFLIEFSFSTFMDVGFLSRELILTQTRERKKEVKIVIRIIQGIFCSFLFFLGYRKPFNDLFAVCCVKQLFSSIKLI